MTNAQLYCGDALTVLKTLPERTVRSCVTSPPYWRQRDYGVVGQLGLERSPEDYVGKMVEVFREVRRGLRNDGTLWLNLGDKWASSWPCDRRSVVGQGSLANGKRAARPSSLSGDLKEKDLIGIPWMVAFALRADGWYLRSDIIWSKPNPMPESVTDRPTKAHEYVFLFSKAARYYYDQEAIAEPGSLNVPWSAKSNGGNQPGAGRNDGNSLTLGKRAGHARRHAGFNARRDAAEAAGGKNGTPHPPPLWGNAPMPHPQGHFAPLPPGVGPPRTLAGIAPWGMGLD